MFLAAGPEAGGSGQSPFPLYVFLVIWSIGFGYGFWWRLMSDEAARAGCGDLTLMTMKQPRLSRERPAPRLSHGQSGSPHTRSRQSPGHPTCLPRNS
jgi:hypothetical protein